MTELANAPDKFKVDSLLEDFFYQSIQKVSSTWPTPLLKVKIAAQCLANVKTSHTSGEETTDK